jgi:hypothetical protein
VLQSVADTKTACLQQLQFNSGAGFSPFVAVLHTIIIIIIIIIYIYIYIRRKKPKVFLAKYLQRLQQIRYKSILASVSAVADTFFWLCNT